MSHLISSEGDTGGGVDCAVTGGVAHSRSVRANRLRSVTGPTWPEGWLFLLS